MQDRIKIVYSWIGPRGPIWNTELPNVLTFASVAEGSQTISHKFWADDTWNRLFSPRKHMFEMYPAIAVECEDSRPFIVPFSLTWRTEFNNYFCGNTGILEFAHMPWHLMRLIRHDNGYIMLDHSVEAFMGDGHLDALHGYFRGIHSLPLHKIIYLTGTMNAADLYEKYCNRKGIPNTLDDRLTIISYPSSQEVISSFIGQGSAEPTYDTERVPEKLFLMWNRRFRRHRIELALALEKNGLVDRSLISFNSIDLERPTTSFEDAIDMNNLINSNRDLHLTPEIVQRFKARLPLVLDGETDVNKMCADMDNASRPFYQRSLVSIVTETNFELPEVTLTEKSFKPAKEKHPFIIVGVKGSLKAMRDMGFKTFSEFWPEDYDEVECPRVRMQRISYVTELIGRWTPEQILDFRRRVKPILEHNWNQLKVSGAEIVANKLYDYIRSHMV